MPLTLVPDWAKPLRTLEGIARKLVLVFIALSFVGWIVFVAGFGESVKYEKSDYEDYDLSTLPRLYYMWAASVVGPVLFLLAALHAVLWRWPSSAVGSVTAVLGVVYISAIGRGLNRSGLSIRANTGDPLTRDQLIFAGGLLTCLFWAVAQAMWLWYPVISLKNILQMLPCKPATGISRKVVLLFLGLSVVGWVLFVAGFIKQVKYLNISATEIGKVYYWAWAASVAGLVLHILAVVHAVLWGLPSLIVGSLTAVLGVFYIAAIGNGLMYTGNLINYQFSDPTIHDDWVTSTGLMFSGSFLTCLFWAVVQAMWPWYATGMETEEELAEDRQKLWKWISFKPYKFLEGIVRKVVLIFIGLSILGWIVFVAGFGKYIKWNYDHEALEHFDLGYAPYLYWGWTVSVGGPVVYLLAVAHAVMWTRISSILGSVTAILGMMYITAVAYGLVWSGIVINDDGKMNWFSSTESNTHHKLLFSGGFLLCLFWALTQAMWFWYPFGTTIALKQSLKVRPIMVLQGIARKIALPLIALSAVGWIVFVAGFGELRTKISNEELDLNDGPWLYWAWAASVVGPVVYILAVVHAVLWEVPSAIVGSLTAILGLMYITAIGFGLIFIGIEFDAAPELSRFDKFHKLMFSGGLISCTFWALVQAVWPWYSSGLEDEREKQIITGGGGEIVEEYELDTK